MRIQPNPNPENKVSSPGQPKEQMVEDEFLTLANMNPVMSQARERAFSRVFSDMDELFRKNQWEEILAVYYPIKEKLPELADHARLHQLRGKLAFALGQIKRFDEAIEELLLCVEQAPNDFYHHNSLAYTAYNSLYAAKNREVFLAGKLKENRIQLAHKHFTAAQAIRSDTITNYYRRGMLFKQIENKPQKAIPMFQRAVKNWESLDDESREMRQREYKNYIKSLYHLASCLLNTRCPQMALDAIKRCLSHDEGTNHVSLLFKFFALGKIQFHLNQFSEAKDALKFALKTAENKPADFVFELLARTYLALNDPERALKTIRHVPENRRRPYIQWTEADILCSLRQFSEAEAILEKCSKRDNRSRHKALVRMARISYLLSRYKDTVTFAQNASAFFREKWNNAYDEGMFWEALGLYRLGDIEAARTLAEDLRIICPDYDKLEILISRLESNDHETNTAN